MSALFGIWNFDERPVEAEDLRRSAILISPHVNGSQTMYALKNVGLVCLPCQATAGSRKESEPYVTPSNLLFGWDGRLDNRKELLHDCTHLCDRNASDLAVIAATFENKKDRTFANLIGDWVLSVWNPAEQTLYLGKDYLGIRHLYYCLTRTGIAWSTHLEPLVVGARLSVDDEYIAGYLANYPSARRTPYREIQAVPPGHFVAIHHGIAVARRYWSVSGRSGIRYKADSDYEEHFRALFREAVKRRLRSDSPVLAELSGGIDSSSIVCMADDLLRKGDAETIRLDTLSTLDPKDRGGDLPYFTQIERQRGRVGHHFNRDDYDDTFYLNDVNFVPQPGLTECTGKLREDLLGVFQKGGYRVLLSGIGGDELLGGVANPFPQLADLIVWPRPIQLAKQLTAWSLVKKRPWIHLLGGTVCTLLCARLRAFTSSGTTVPPWIDPVFAARHRLALRQLGPLGNMGIWQPSRRESAQTVVAIARQMSCFSVHGVAGEERRYPYLDQSLVEFLLAIPATQIMRPGERRSLMRRSLIAIVPKEVLWRKTKAFVTRRVLAAFDSSWSEVESLCRTPISADLGYLNPHCLIDHLRAARNGDPTYMVYLLKTLYLESWLQSATRHIRLLKNAPSTAAMPILQSGA
jgi:asparagine synthase (glutamine-hydrolysing)